MLPFVLQLLMVVMDCGGSYADLDRQPMNFTSKIGRCHDHHDNGLILEKRAKKDNFCGKNLGFCKASMNVWSNTRSPFLSQKWALFMAYFMGDMSKFGEGILRCREVATSRDASIVLHLLYFSCPHNLALLRLFMPRKFYQSSTTLFSSSVT